MASMRPACILSISSNMKMDLAQALTLPRIHDCNWSWVTRGKPREILRYATDTAGVGGTITLQLGSTKPAFTRAYCVLPAVLRTSRALFCSSPRPHIASSCPFYRWEDQGTKSIINWDSKISPMLQNWSVTEGRFEPHPAWFQGPAPWL